MSFLRGKIVRKWGQSPFSNEKKLQQSENSVYALKTIPPKSQCTKIPLFTPKLSIYILDSKFKNVTLALTIGLLEGF